MRALPPRVEITLLVASPQLLQAQVALPIRQVAYFRSEWHRTPYLGHPAYTLWLNQGAAMACGPDLAVEPIHTRCQAEIFLATQ